MRSGTHGRVISALARISFLHIVLILCPSALISSNRTVNRIVCRAELSLTKRQDLADKLRIITGWPELAFDQNGALRIGSKSAMGGSQSARDLLNQAISGSNIIILEDASNRSDVVFCRVVPGRWTNDKGGNPPAYVVMIDFTDFDHLMGDPAALRAFDVGWGLLHEIDHVVNESSDSASISDAGECEDHINLMRRECDLPLRTDYFFTYFGHSEQSNFKTRFVRLAFEQENSASTKHRRYWLIWDATLVGGLPQDEIAQRRFGL